MNAAPLWYVPSRMREHSKTQGVAAVMGVHRSADEADAHALEYIVAIPYAIASTQDPWMSALMAAAQHGGFANDEVVLFRFVARPSEEGEFAFVTSLWEPASEADQFYMAAWFADAAADAMPDLKGGESRRVRAIIRTKAEEIRLWALDAFKRLT